MKFLRVWAELLIQGTLMHARWEIKVAQTILSDKKRVLLL